MTPTRETFGNIPPSSQALFYLVAAVSLGVGAIGFWRRVRRWRQGQPIPPPALAAEALGNLLARWRPGLRRLWVEGLGQQRVRGRGLSSWAHGSLFIGFLVLLLGTTLLEVDHLAGMVSEKLHFHHGAYYVGYEFTLDVLGLVFLLGTALFFGRRLRRPASVGHRTTDWYVLGSFLTIGVTGYVVEALRITWQRPVGLGAWCSPVGWALASVFRGLSELQARHWHLAVWWLHALLVFGFLAAIPYTRLLHILTGPLNLLCAPPAVGFLAPVTMAEAEAAGRLGVRDLRHFTWQQLMSLDACMECGRCEEACPATATAKPLSPKRLVQDLRGLLDGLAPGGAGDPSSGNEERFNVHARIAAETLWSCTACSACGFVCPVRVDPLRLILDLRRNLVAEGGLRGTAAVVLRRLQASGNPWGLPPEARTDWMRGRNPPASVGQPTS